MNPAGSFTLVAVAGALTWFVGRPIVMARREERLYQQNERRAELYRAAQEPPPPLTGECGCDLCTHKVTFQEWVERRYFAQQAKEQGFEGTYRDVEELEVYWPEEWEVTAS